MVIKLQVWQILCVVMLYVISIWGVLQLADWILMSSLRSYIKTLLYLKPRTKGDEWIYSSKRMCFVAWIYLLLTIMFLSFLSMTFWGVVAAMRRW